MPVTPSRSLSSGRRCAVSRGEKHGYPSPRMAPLFPPTVAREPDRASPRPRAHVLSIGPLVPLCEKCVTTINNAHAISCKMQPQTCVVQLSGFRSLLLCLLVRHTSRTLSAPLPELNILLSSRSSVEAARFSANDLMPKCRKRGSEKKLRKVSDSVRGRRPTPTPPTCSVHRVRGVKFTFYILHVNLHFFTVKCFRPFSFYTNFYTCQKNLGKIK